MTAGERPADEAVPGPRRRLGVYVCQCGGNISDHVDVERVVAAVAGRGGRGGGP